MKDVKLRLKWKEKYDQVFESLGGALMENEKLHGEIARLERDLKDTKRREEASTTALLNLEEEFRVYSKGVVSSCMDLAQTISEGRYAELDEEGK